MSLTAKSGYKQSEIGEIPEIWDCLTVQQLIDKGAIYGHLDGNHGELYPRSHEFKNFGVPYIGANNFYSGQVDLQGCKFLSEERAVLFKKGVAKDGDILFAHNATVGPVAKLKTSLKYVILSTTATYFRVNGTLLNNDYLMHYMRSELFSSQYSAIMSQSTRNQVPITAQRKLFVVVPPIEEQSKIASSLSVVDALISSLDQLIAKKRDIQQATMQQLVTGQCRLPGFSGVWEVKPLRALGNTYGGLAGKTKNDFGHGEARYIPFMNVMTDTVIDTSWLEPVDVAPNEAQNLAKKGDLFFNGSSETPEEVGFCSVLLEEIPNLYLNSFCFGFRFNTSARVNGLFFAYWFRSKAGRAAMSVLAQGATRYNIAKSAFMQLEIPQPSEEEQTAIATILSDMDAALAALEARRDKARQLKQGMMQELLTGRIRLV